MIDWVTIRWPGRRIAVLVQRHPHGVMDQRPEEARLHVVLAGPDQLHGAAAADLVGDGHALGHVVGREVGAATERAAGEQGLDLDRAGQGLDDLGRVHLVQGLGLGAMDQLDLAAVDDRHAVHRLHGRMGQVGEVVGGLEHRRALAGRGRGRVALGVERLPLQVGGTLAGGDVAPLLGDGRRTPGLGLGLVPLDLQRLAAHAGGVGGVGHHRDPGRDLMDVDHPGHLPGLVGIEALHRRAEARRVGDHRHQHVRQLDVLGVAGRAGALDQAVLAAHPVGADQGEGLGILQGRVLGRRDLGGVGDQFAEPRALAAGVADHPVLDGDLADRDVPPRRRRLHEHRPRPGPGLAQLLPGVGDRRRAAGQLDAGRAVAVELGVGRRVDHLDPAPVGVQLLGDDGRQAGMVALAELDVLGQHRHRPVRVELDERPEGAGLDLGAGAHQVGRRAADQQGAADQGGADHQSRRLTPSWRRSFSNGPFIGPLPGRSSPRRRRCRHRRRWTPAAWRRARRPPGPRSGRRPP